MEVPAPEVAVFWFRRDLRFMDNHGLFQALSRHERVLPIFIFDRNILDPLKDRRDKRVAFIHRTLTEMHRQLREIGSGLPTFYGTPATVFGSLLRRFRITAVFCNRDYEPYARQRDREIETLLTQNGSSFHAFKDQVVFDRDEVVTGNGKPYTVFTPYKRKWTTQLEDWHTAAFACDKHFGRFSKIAEPAAVVPLAEMGFQDPGVEYPPPCIDRELLEAYHRTRDLPASEGTTRIGLHLRFGTVSIRELARKARAWSESWLNELIWREFFMQVLYHFPRVVTQSFRPEYDRIPWSRNEKAFARWCEGNTGIPIVDAGMRQLNQTGFMHNRVRMITASFLCKHLLIDWRWGERYFAEKLLDFDLAANNGNWQWAAGTGCDAAPYFRVFNPWLQAQKFDKDHRYVKRWVPEHLSPDYPAPMVDHALARKRAVQVYKKALHRGSEEKSSQTRLFDA